MKYKVGDIVKLRDDLEFGKYYGGMQLSETFHGGIIGKKGKIKRCASYGYWTMFKGGRVWCDITDEMIEGLWEECKSSEQVSKSESKYKLIDILNKIANGELKEGTKFVYRGNMYIWEDNMILNTTNTEILDIADRSDLNMELELIEPQEPTECEHEWAEYTGYNAKTGETKHYRECVECGLQEEIEDNTTEKIEELIDWYQLIDGTTDEEKIHIVWNKLNEVIRYINK